MVSGVPHPRATKQFAAVEPVERPLAQAIYESKHAAAQKAAAQGKAYKPPKGGFRYVPVGERHGPTLPAGPERERRDEQMRKEHAAREEAAKERRENA